MSRDLLVGAATGRANGLVDVARRVDLATIMLLAVLAAAFVLRAYDLDRTSIWLDEAVSWLQSRGTFWNVFVATARDNYPPLHNIVLYGVINLFGDSEVALRAPSVVFGTAMVLMTFILARSLYDRQVGLVAAVLCATSGFLIWYSQEARMYAMLAFFAALYLTSLVRVLRMPSRLTMTVHVLAGLGVLYSHPYGMFTVTGAGLAVLMMVVVRPGSLALPVWRWIGLQCLIGIGFAPWLYILFGRFQAIQEGFWIAEPSFDTIVNATAGFASGPVGGVVLSAFAVGALFRGIADRHIDRPAPEQRPLIRFPISLEIGWRELLLLMSFAFPIAAGFLISVVSEPIFLERYLIATSVPFFVLAAAGLVRIARIPAVTMAIVAALMIFAAPHVAHPITERERSDWRGAVSFYQEHQTDEAPIVVKESWDRAPLRYYHRSDHPEITGVDERGLFDLLGSENHDVWVFLGSWDRHYLDQIESVLTRRYLVAKRAEFHGVRVLFLTPLVIRVPERSP